MDTEPIVLDATTITEDDVPTETKALAEDIEVVLQVVPEDVETYIKVLVIATIVVPDVDTVTYVKSPLIEDDDEDHVKPLFEDM